jgi:intracellular septation protein A
MSPRLRVVASLVPLFAFWWVEDAYGLRAGILAAMGFAALDLAWSRWAEGRVNRLTLFSAAMVAGLGGMSLWSEDPTLFLLSPAIGDVVFAGILVGGGVLGQDLLVLAMQEQEPDLDLHPLELRFFRGVGQRFAANLLVHALWVTWAATQPRETWIWVSGVGQFALLGVQMIGEAAYGRLVVGPAVEEALAES